MKKYFKILFVLLIIATLFIPYTISYGTDSSEENVLLEIAEEVSISDDLEITINIENIEYSQFIFILESIIDISSAEISNETEESSELEIEVDDEDNKITIEIDNSSGSLSQIVLKISLPEDVEVGDTISLVATVTSLSDNEEEISEEYSIKVVEDSENSSDDEESSSNISGDNMDFSSDSNSGFSNDMNSNGSTENSMSSNSMSDSSSSMLSSTTSGSLGETITYNGSDNNYLSELTVTSYELNKTFSKEETTYFVTVDSDVDSLEITVTPEDDGATVCIYGNTNLSTGENKILITVTAENGNTRTYRIYVTKG